MEAPAAACAFCNKPLGPSEVLYTPDARVVCAACNAKVELAVTEVRAGHNIRNASISSLVMAAISFIFNPFWVMTIASMIAGIGSLTAISRKGDERFTRHADKGAVYACSIIALVLDAIVIVITILAFAAATSAENSF